MQFDANIDNFVFALVWVMKHVLNAHKIKFALERSSEILNGANRVNVRIVLIAFETV